jgi:transposase
MAGLDAMMAWWTKGATEQTSQAMKTYSLSTTPPLIQAMQTILVHAGEAPCVCLGLDLELHGAQGAAVIGGGTPRDLGKHPRADWLALARWLIGQRCEVHVIEEACGFGWQFHRDLLSTGAKAIVSAPEVLNGKRKTDQRDARCLAALLCDRVMRGHQHSLRTVRVPGIEAQRRRSEGRHRTQMVEARNRLEAVGRGMMWDHDFHDVPEGWWGPRKWPKLLATLLAAGKEWLVEMLAPLQQTILGIVRRIQQLDAILATHAAQMQLSAPAPKGLGEPTRVRLAAEAQDWHRFDNRKQVGSFLGLCPSEHSSGGRQRLGSIDRMGNRRMRTMLVEAVWRLHKWNKGWRGFAKFAHVFGAGAKVGGATRKKAVVACARLLGIDLWRLETGRIALDDVGLVAATTPVTEADVMS